MVSAVVKDGKIVDTRSESLSDSTQKSSASGSLDKEAFLQLLVAQMQYQDPLEPMDNTEYVSQLATFSELEAMNNLNDSMGFSRAASLVGSNVIMRTVSKTTGDTYMTQGVVDYVVYENGEAYLSIEDELFSLDDLDTVISDKYWEEYKKNHATGDDKSDVGTLMAKIAKLPDSKDVTEEHEAAIKEAREMYNSLSDEDKKKVDNEALYYLIKAEAALSKIIADRPPQDTTEGTDTEDTEGKETEDNTGEEENVPKTE